MDQRSLLYARLVRQERALDAIAGRVNAAAQAAIARWATPDKPLSPMALKRVLMAVDAELDAIYGPRKGGVHDGDLGRLIASDVLDVAEAVYGANIDYIRRRLPDDVLAAMDDEAREGEA